MNKGKATVGIGLIYVILLGVFNLLVFTIFKTHTSVFWLSYAFMTVAFVVQIASMNCRASGCLARPRGCFF